MKSRRLATLACLTLTLLSPVPLATAHDEPITPPPGEPAAQGFRPCRGGVAGGYPCRNVDLLALLPRSVFGFGEDIIVNDVWGWTDPADGTDYALVGTSAGTAFVRLGAGAPEVVGVLHTRFFNSTWRDIKVYRDHAFIGADASPGHGIQVFDLTRLRNLAGNTVFAADATYLGPGLGLGGGIQLGSSHNLVVNEETGFLYVVGSDTCAGGLHVVDVSTPTRPRFRGCFEDDGYTHDAQCVVYRGPDAGFTGRELCFAANEDTVTVVDVTDKNDPAQVARVSYPNVGYTHQVWLTEDHRFLLVNDERDEQRFGNHTRTLVFDVADPAAPRLASIYEGETHASTHNLYVRGGLIYAANYAAGLQVLRLDDSAAGGMREVAFFDTRPGDDAPGFRGAWSNYPFYADGKVVVTSITEGLFVLRPFPASAATPTGGGGPIGPRPDPLGPVAPTDDPEDRPRRFPRPTEPVGGGF